MKRLNQISCAVLILFLVIYMSQIKVIPFLLTTIVMVDFIYIRFGGGQR